MSTSGSWTTDAPTVSGPTYPREHHWPATVSYAGVTLAPFRRRDVRAWDLMRRRNSSWLRTWDATTPAGGQRPGGRSMIGQFTYEAKRGEMLPWLVWFSPDEEGQGQLVGQLTVSAIRYGAARWASIGYWVDERWAGRGIIPAAVALATDYCFRTMRLHRVEIDIRPENTRSLRVVEKLGFRYEGLRPRFLHIDGDWRDHECFALNAEEVPEGMWARLGPGIPRHE
ncbi:MAG: GNAT family N-acetyltransferase [Actinobacteria bacterium]|nr:GNAT family N-acetyltransferase [Actinomycetota bacterium]